MSRGRWVNAAVALALTLAGGCGVPTEDAPREIVPPGGPYPAFGGASPGSQEVGTVEEPLCFVRDGSLVRVVRRIRIWPTIETQIQHLLAGPNETERGAGLTSALPGTTVVTGLRLAGGQVTVELGDAGAGRSDAVLAYGQIVCTLTTRDDVVAVAFVQGGQPIGIPRADGSLTRAPLSAADYASLME